MRVPQDNPYAVGRARSRLDDIREHLGERVASRRCATAGRDRPGELGLRYGVMTTVTIDAITISGDPARWAALGFTVTDRVLRLGEVAVCFADRPNDTGMLSWSLCGAAGTSLDGLPTERCTRLGSTIGAAEHANGVIAIDHIVVMSPQLERTVAVLQRAGLDLRRIREEPTPAGAPRQAFFRLGREILEVVQEPEEAVAREGGPDRPAHFWGLALLSPDIERTAGAFAPHLSPIRAAVQRGRRIATVARTAELSVPVALMSPEVHKSGDGDTAA